ncbi:NAD(P)/FAD-dependent oxidoreductase [Exiguobacterium sp. SL-10]|uniref:NAD(P)/FAD-dependent oxidoreductase n=1 Tax=unclassified Exiguobacterium TaxID=2644629 RepID=UPI00103AA3DF|nr:MULTISPECIES: NAD(P)/FAD-dependent oxidoreductase [unclassified Exiguobacterium]TCI20738.1 NAD(P)/FAD-dependent oxidoreductase [Exiguobacterium sp. SL-9]TCI28977.1 NAD(P)/FAD-dependent oxidoreductase [Exiguobacterium sp. SL-10]
MSEQDLYDVTIIGGGPAGLYATFYSGLRGMKTKLIEFQPHLGGKIHVYPEKMIWDVGGVTPTTGARLIEQLVEQGLTFDPTVVLGEKVEAMTKNSQGHFVLDTTHGQHISKTVIVATGSGILQPQKIDISGAERFEVSNLHYTVKSLMAFKGKTVLISGGGNSAIDWANELEPIAERVILTYRKEALKGHESQVDKLLCGRVDCRLHTQIEDLISRDGMTIHAVALVDCGTGARELVEVDEVVINHGYEQDSALLGDCELQIEMVDGFYVKGNASSESSVPGLYAAGDILTHEGKVHLIAGAFQDAANAVNRAKTFIDPDATKAAMVSSHNERLKTKNRDIIEQALQKQ